VVLLDDEMTHSVALAAEELDGIYRVIDEWLPRTFSRRDNSFIFILGNL